MISFNPLKHAYVNTLTNEPYTSVTTLLGKFKEEFEKDKISKAVAERKGIPQQVILDEWDETSKKACDFGTSLHAAIEDYCKNGIVDTTFQEAIESFRDLGDFRVKTGALIEHLVYNHDYKIAGTADIIMPQGGYFDVYDLKSNKKFNFFSKYNKFLKSPVDHLMECEYNSYTLQLSMYAYFYHLMTGRKVRQLTVFYYDKDLKNFTKYPMIYLQNDVINILNKYKSDYNKQT